MRGLRWNDILLSEGLRAGLKTRPYPTRPTLMDRLRVERTAIRVVLAAGTIAAAAFLYARATPPRVVMPHTLPGTPLHIDMAPASRPNLIDTHPLERLDGGPYPDGDKAVRRRVR